MSVRKTRDHVAEFGFVGGWQDSVLVIRLLDGRQYLVPVADVRIASV